jgi:hypothetical protein
MQSPSMFDVFGLQIGFIIVSALISGCGLLLFWRYLRRVERIGEDLIACQLRCAKTSADYVKREDFRGQMLRFEDMIVRMHERVDWIAAKLGGSDEVRRNG